MTQDTPNQSELKPCPFCGGIPVTEHFDSGRWQISCGGEGCLASITWGSFARQTEAITAWNTRPQPEGVSALADELANHMRGVTPRPPADEAFSLPYDLCFRIDAALRTPKPATTEEAVEAVSIPRELFDFLMGSRSIEGYWFGDTRPDMRGAFWWRSVIRDRALSTSPVTKPDEKSELARFRTWARQVSVAFVGLSGGGSEMFTQIGDEYYVDPESCTQRIREKIDAARALRASPPPDIREAVLEEAALDWPKDHPLPNGGLLFMEGNLTSDTHPFSVGALRPDKSLLWEKRYTSFRTALRHFDRCIAALTPLTTTGNEGERSDG